MSKRLFYRAGRLITASAFALGCTKTLGSTGEHDVWSGSGTLPQPAGTVIKVSSASVQDAASVTDVWSVSGKEGNDPAQKIAVDGVTHGAIGFGDDLAPLADAVNNGSKTTYAFFIATLPDGGDDVVVSVGATDYTVQRDSELTTDELADAVATAMAADPDYDATVFGGDSGAVLLVAKTPAVEAPAVSVDFPGTGSGGAQLLVSHGPASTVATAVVDEADDLIITATAPGVAYVVTAESDNVAATHIAVGGAGTGIRKVLVRYLDADGYELEEELSLDGTTAVQTSRTATALLDVQASAVGSGGAAAGTITITDGAGSPVTLGTIAAGDAETHRVAWKAGTAQRFVVIGVHGINVSGTPATLRLRSSGQRGAWLLTALYLAANSGQVVLDLSDTPIVLQEGEAVRATLEGNGATCYVELVGYTESH